jgi:hypothetical protein
MKYEIGSKFSGSHKMSKALEALVQLRATGMFRASIVCRDTKRSAKLVRVLTANKSSICATTSSSARLIARFARVALDGLQPNDRDNASATFLLTLTLSIAPSRRSSAHKYFRIETRRR